MPNFGHSEQLTGSLIHATVSDMKKPRTYTSPLREARAQETRERILAAVADWMRNDAHGDFSLDAIATEAGIHRRTVFRHFETREALLEAFWGWINRRLVPRTLPGSLTELVDGPRTTFPRFDEEESVIRGSLHTPAGRAMRMAVVAARRAAFRDALLDVTRGASAADRRRLEAVAHALYSAAAWESMRDYAGLSGSEAGDAASWALDVLCTSVRRSARRAEADTRRSTHHRK